MNEKIHILTSTLIDKLFLSSIDRTPYHKPYRSIAEINFQVRTKSIPHFTLIMKQYRPIKGKLQHKNESTK